MSLSAFVVTQRAEIAIREILVGRLDRPRSGFPVLPDPIAEETAEYGKDEDFHTRVDPFPVLAALGSTASADG